MSVRCWLEPSPIGGLGIEVSDIGVRRVEFRGQIAAPSDRDAEVGAAFEAYFAGDSDPLDALPIDLSLARSDVDRAVLVLLREGTPRGETITYGQLAERAEMPGAAQLVGQIMGANPVPVIVPCHRVIAAGGEIGGFGGGLPTKRALFEIERIAHQATLF